MDIKHPRKHLNFNDIDHKGAYTLERTIGAAGFDYVELGKFQQPEGAFVIIASTSIIYDTTVVSTDFYIITGDYNRTTGLWELVYPSNRTDQDMLIIVNINNDEMTLRLYRTSSSFNPLPTVTKILNMGPSDTVFTKLTGSGSMSGSPVTTVYDSTLISQRDDKVWLHGPINMDSNVLEALIDPVAAQQAATKNYHDTSPAPPSIHGIADNTKHSGALVNDNITLGDSNGLVKDSGVSISTIVGGLNYQSTWNASTNTPTLADGTGTKGHFYEVSVGGVQDLGSGSITFEIGDWVIHNGSIWEKLDRVDIVKSVFGRIGIITALASDYDASQIDNDSGVAGAFVDDALDTLAGLISPGLFPINCSQGSNLAGNQTLYCGPHGEFIAEAEAQIRMMKSDVVRLTINTTGNTLNTNSTLQVRKNGVAAGAAITINATTSGRQTLVLSQSFADGDLLSVELVLGGTAGQRLDIRELIVTAKAVV